MERSCYFLGDTLFIDVGRLVSSKSGTHDARQLALPYSFVKKIMTLADDVIVYPAHGAGVRKNMSKETVSTIVRPKAT
jgi:glyoxylase-like metal-dependent hydrolase (beta-lactamase superfamily II)